MYVMSRRGRGGRIRKARDRWLKEAIAECEVPQEDIDFPGKYKPKRNISRWAIYTKGAVKHTAVTGSKQMCTLGPLTITASQTPAITMYI